jgi:iron only hydrogenase large subunit-like protein
MVDETNNHVIVAVSPQSIASLAAYLNLPSMEVYLRIRSFLKALGVSDVVDMSAVGDLALVEASEEFIQRYISLSVNQIARSFDLCIHVCL